MCGLSGYVARESAPNNSVLKILFSEGSKRGTDGFGWVRLTSSCDYIGSKKYKGCPTPSDICSDIVSLDYGDILISNHRAAPETEKEVSEAELEKTVQPIIDRSTGLYLVHNGAVSNVIVNELKKKYTFKTHIDSEAILWAYIKFGRNMKNAMEYLSGGFAFLMVDAIKRKLYAVSGHNPLYTGYVKGHGLCFSSTEEGVFSVISDLKGFPVNKNTMNLWEDYYGHRLPEYTIMEIDLDSGMVNQYSFEPRYITNTFDIYKQEKESDPVVLVSASGGLDSSVTLATLKAAGMNPIAVHFNYGHRGYEAELDSIRKITNILNIPMYYFDISDQVKILDSGMLTNADSRIITGTESGLKTTAAWTVYRNHLFMTYMGALAESLIMDNNHSIVYLTGGFMNLSESGCLVDCPENLIQTHDRKDIRPRDVTVGTELLAYDCIDRRLCKTIVQEVFKTQHTETYKIFLKYEENNTVSTKELYLSGEHPVFVKKVGWCHANELRVGDTVCCYTDCFYHTMNITETVNGYVVERVEVIMQEQEMFNFHCEPIENFFVNKILTHNSYPDNSERFVDAATKFFKFSVTGTRLRALYGLCNILKTEQYILLRELHLLSELSPLLISCDRPILETITNEDGSIETHGCNCFKDGKPACGSGLLSYWASKIAGVPDLRRYYEVDDPSYSAYEPSTSYDPKQFDVKTIVAKLKIPDENKEILLDYLENIRSTI